MREVSVKEISNTIMKNTWESMNILESTTQVVFKNNPGLCYSCNDT